MRFGPLAALIWLAPAPSALAEDIRDFNADTPGKSYTPYTVSQGFFQLESDSFHITEMGGTQTIEVLDPVFKYGLTEDLELELQTDGFFDITTTTHRKTATLTGYGDITPELKLNLFGNDWQLFSAAIKAGIKVPTAYPGIGNGAFEYYFIVPTQLALPFDFSLQIQQEIDLLKNQTNTGKHFNYAEDISLSRTIKQLTLSVEFFAQSGTDPNAQAEYTADIGVGYAITPTIVISFGTYFGLNRFAPSVESYTGFGIRF
jgi:hypothetical protein